jgi:proteasome accessory factor B/proteasome accessory factor C
MAVAQGHVPRLLHLVRLLEKRGEMPLAEVATELGVGEDELAEDVRLLSTCGVPPYSPADLFEIEIESGRVRLGRGLLRLPRFQLTSEEVAGLRLAARMAEAEGWGESRGLKRALGKLEDALVPEERERGRKLARRLAFAGVSPDQARKLEVLERAMRESRAVEIVYFTESSESVSKRVVRPYAVITAPGGRYLVGHDSKRNDVITFRVDHVVRLRLTAERFVRPKDFDPTPYVDWKSPAKRGVPAVLRFDASAARLARDRFPDAKPGPKGSLLVRLEAWAGPPFCRFVLSWAGACEVLEPETVRAAVAEYAAEVAAAHDA